MKKLGPNAMPFTFQLPKNAPPSVTLQPSGEQPGKPCGVEYSLRVYVGDNMEDKAHKRSSIAMGIRVIQFAPSQAKDGRAPCTVVRRDFVLSPGDLEMELNLDRQVLEHDLFTFFQHSIQLDTNFEFARQMYHHGDTIALHISIHNRSNKTVKKIRAQVLQCIDVCLFDSGTYKTPVVTIDTTYAVHIEIKIVELEVK